MRETVLKPYLDKLTEAGGTGTCLVYLHRAESSSDIPEDADIDRINVRVELMVPMAFGGHELIAKGEGLDVDCTVHSMRKPQSLGEALNNLRLSAYKRAVQDLDHDIRAQVRKVRPGTSAKRTARKSRVILSTFDSWKFV